MKVISITNQKGGTGKTTTAHAIGAGLTKRGYRVLLIDLDAQQNLTFTANASPQGQTIADLLQEVIDAKPDKKIQPWDAIQGTQGGHIIAGNQALAAADTVLADVSGSDTKLKELLKPLRTSYDYCIIDTPPTLGTLTINALAAADEVIAPAQADIYSLIAIGQLYATIHTVKKYSNKKLSFKGIVLTRYNGRSVISRELTQQLEQAATEYGTKLFNTKIRECTAIKEAEYLQQNIFDYAPRSNAAADYNALIDEILAGTGGPEQGTTAATKKK